MAPEEFRDQSEQLPLFTINGEVGGDAAQKTSPTAPDLTTGSPIAQALGAFEKYMQERGFTENTQQAFRLDLQILADFLEPAKMIGEISTAALNGFLKWMEHSRGVPCSPKTLERRITTLKVFFGWLAEIGALPRDPASPLIHHSVSAPLPDILTDDQIAAILAVTQALRQGDAEHKPDARPHALFTLIQHTAIKKSECVSIHLNHIDLTDAGHPALWVRYRQPNRRHKERRIPLPTWWPAVLREYLDQYPSRQFLFPWSARNLEYVLTGVAQEAGAPRLTFEMIRWTCAVRDYVGGMERDALRQKLGLSDISWYEVEPKLALLAQRSK